MSKVSTTISKAAVAAATDGVAASSKRKVGDELVVDHRLQLRPGATTAPIPGMAAGASYDQFDDAEDDLPVSIPPPEPPHTSSKPEDTTSSSTPTAVTRDSDVDVACQSQEAPRRNGGKRSPKGTPKLLPPGPKRPPPTVMSRNNHDPHCDGDALETLAMACLQERKERPKIDKGEKVEQDQVTRTDVLCGRGGMTNHHPGNVFYRRVVRLKQESYVVAAKRKKVEIATDIVHIIRCLSPPGRFLRKDDNDANAWVEIGDKAAVAKTSQALREGAPDIRSLVVGNQASGESTGPSGGTKGMDAPAISDRAKLILASVRKKHPDQGGDFDAQGRTSEKGPQLHNMKFSNHNHQQGSKTPNAHSPQGSPQQGAANGPEGWEQAVQGHEGWEQAMHGHEGWGQAFASAAQGLSIQENPLRAMARVHPNLAQQRMGPPYIAPPHMQLPPGHVAVLPPGCPIPPGFMLLAPTPQPQLIPVHQMSHGMGVQIGGRMMPSDQLARSLYGHYFVPQHGHAPPEFIGSAQLLSRIENDFKRKQIQDNNNNSHENGDGDGDGEDVDDEEDEERDEHGQQVSGSEEEDLVESPPKSKRSRLL